MFKRSRNKRFEELIKAGFMPFEARWLSMIPFHGHPALVLMLRRRRRLQERRIQEADKKSWSQAKRQRIWNMRTKKMYQRRHWLAVNDHATGQGPRAGEPNPFAVYRFYEKNEVNPLPGDSKKSKYNNTGAGSRWKLDRAQILLFQAKRAWNDGDWTKYHSSLSELDDIIEHSPTKKKVLLKAVKQKLTRRF